MTLFPQKIGIQRLLLAVTVCLLPAAMGSKAVAAPTVPDLGLVLNLDGDNAFPAETLAESIAELRKEVDKYAEKRVTTLCYSTGAGSDILLYPTKVGTNWGWRKTKYDSDPKWAPRIDRMRRNALEGGDALRTAGTRAKERGMRFFPSQRMNDAHFTFGLPPEEYPLTGKFWLEHRDMVIGESPIKSKPEYGQLLDYSRKEVRDYRLATIFEAIDRNADLIDGFELDFTRFQIFFPAGRATEQAPLMTDLVAQVRQKLDAVGIAQKRELLLIVRVPPSPANCVWAGLEVDKWCVRRLVDVLVPSQMMTTGFEQPIDEFQAMARPAGAKVYSGLLARVSWTFPLTAASTGGQFGKPDRAMSVEQLRGAVSNALHLGADGLYLFNFQHYATWAASDTQTGLVDLSRPASVAPQDQVFSLSKAYWADFENGYEYRKQVPTALEAGKKTDFRLLVGASPETCAAAECVLRVGLRKPPVGGGTVEVTLNGHKLVSKPISQVALPSTQDADGKKAADTREDLPTHFVVVRLTAPLPIVAGQNVVGVRVSDPGESSAGGVTDVELGVFQQVRQAK